MEGKLARWVREELRRRGRGGRDLTYEEAEKQTGISPATFTRILRNEPTSVQTCRLLAPWLHRSQETILRAAGLLLAEQESIESVDEEIVILERRLDEIMARLSRSGQEDVLWYAQSLIERERVRESDRAHEEIDRVAAG